MDPANESQSQLDREGREVPPCAGLNLYGIDEAYICAILQMVPEVQNERIVIAGHLNSELPYLFFGIPLWFDYVKYYLILTNRRLIVATSRLWSGRKATSVDFALIEAIEVIIGRKRIMIDSPSKVSLRFKKGSKVVSFLTNNHEFAARFAEMSKPFLAHDRAESAVDP